jgi:hypothetical protein
MSHSEFIDGGELRKPADASIVVPADSTPQVEGFHLVLTRLISQSLKDLISEKPGKRN